MWLLLLMVVPMLFCLKKKPANSGLQEKKREPSSTSSNGTEKKKTSSAPKPNDKKEESFKFKTVEGGGTVEEIGTDLGDDDMSNPLLDKKIQEKLARSSVKKKTTPPVKELVQSEYANNSKTPDPRSVDPTLPTKSLLPTKRLMPTKSLDLAKSLMPTNRNVSEADCDIEEPKKMDKDAATRRLVFTEVQKTKLDINTRNRSTLQAK